MKIFLMLLLNFNDYSLLFYGFWLFVFFIPSRKKQVVRYAKAKARVKKYFRSTLQVQTPLWKTLQLEILWLCGPE